MAFRRWMNNAFWENEEQTSLNCILEMKDDVGRVTTQVMLLNRNDEEGNPNPMFEEVVSDIGEDIITQNTEERVTRKKAEAEEKKQRDIEHAKARKLEELFNYKMEVFEIDQIKNSKNRKLKGKIRRAKSRLEVDMYGMELLKSESENESVE